MQERIYVICKKAKDKDVLYHQLMCDFGYRQSVLTMEKEIIAEFADVTIRKLCSMKENECIECCTIVRGK